MTTLNIQVSTWDKPNYELYDGEAEQYKCNEFVISRTGFLYRNNEDNVTYYAEEFKSMLCDGYKLLLQVSTESDHFVLPKQDDLWIQLEGRPSQNSQFGFPRVLDFTQVRPNDVIKLGKKLFKLISIGNSELMRPVHYENNLLEGNYDSLVDTPSDARNQCRVCLRTSYSETDPLLSVCRCSGTAKYIHYQCLRQWLNQQIQIQVISQCLRQISAKCVRCELCLTFYPPQVYFNSRQFQLYDLGSMERHVIIEECDNNSIMVLNFNQQAMLTLGRGHESEIRINEITISRNHVKFWLNQDSLFIQDQQSKFGTLVKVQSQIRISENQNLHLQSGRSRIEIKCIVQKKKFCYLLCGCADD